MHGTASSVTSALVAVVIGVVVGGLIGLLAGFLGGWVDAVLARFVDVLLAIPGFLLAVVVVSSLGFETINAAIATGVSAVAVFARVMRSEVLKTRSAVFVEAALPLRAARAGTCCCGTCCPTPRARCCRSRCSSSACRSS